MPVGNPNIVLAGEKTRFSENNQPDNSGRKKNIFRETQKNFDISLEDLQQVLKDLLSATAFDLKQLAKEIKNPDSKEPMLRLAVASAIITSVKAGNLTQINNMLDRLFGKAEEVKKIIGDQERPIQFIINGKSAINPDSTNGHTGNTNPGTDKQ